MSTKLRPPCVRYTPLTLRRAAQRTEQILNGGILLFTLLYSSFLSLLIIKLFSTNQMACFVVSLKSSKILLCFFIILYHSSCFSIDFILLHPPFIFMHAYETLLLYSITVPVILNTRNASSSHLLQFYLPKKERDQPSHFKQTFN